MMIKCPNCNKRFRLPSVFQINVENYGSDCLIYKHKKCGINIALSFERIAKFTGAHITDFPESFRESQLNY